MRFYFYLPLLIVFIFSSCKSPADDRNAILKLDPQKSTVYSFGDFFKFEESVVLETIEESILGSIRKISISEKYIYILTWGEAQVFIFDREGKYITKIDRNGSGPGEYNYVVDMYIDHEKDLIYLYDKTQKVLFCFNHNQDLVKKIDLAVDLESFTILENGTIAGYSFLNHNILLDNEIWRLWFFDSSGELVGGDLAIDRNYLGNSIGLSSSFCRRGAKTYFIPYSENNLYSIDYEGLRLVQNTKFDFNERTIPEELFEMDYKDLWPTLNNSYIMYGEYVGKKTILFNVYHSDKRLLRTCISDLDGKRFVFMDDGMMVDSENELPLSLGKQNRYLDGEALVALLEPYKLESYKFRNPDSYGSALSERVSESDNPVILIYKER